MQKMLGLVRKACQEFDLIEENDKIAVGVSGGKDSLVLLATLAKMRRFADFNYTLQAITIDPKFGGVATDYTSVAILCKELEVPFTLIETDIGSVVFDIRKEPNPCSLCANMRRGALHNTAKSLDCNKLALGHSFDDTVETFIMNLFREGRVGCYAPKTFLTRKEITVIRPMVFATEKEIISCATRNDFSIVKSMCPANKKTYREEIKKFLEEKERADKGFKLRIFGALRRSGANGWGYKTV